MIVGKYGNGYDDDNDCYNGGLDPNRRPPDLMNLSLLEPSALGRGHRRSSSACAPPAEKLRQRPIEARGRRCAREPQEGPRANAGDRPGRGPRGSPHAYPAGAIVTPAA